MDKRTSAVAIGGLAIVAETVLIALGRVDIAALSIVPTISLQVLNLIYTGHVDTKVNGQMTALVEAKTIRPEDLIPPTNTDEETS